MRLSMIRIACSGVAASVLLCAAVAPASAQMTQQEKMSACSKQNKGKKGDDYKSAQSDCLKNGPTPVAAAPMTPQQKMAACSKQNKGKKGDDFKNAQSACLKS